MLHRPCSCARQARSFVTTASRQAKAAAKGKGQPVKRKAAQGFAKKSGSSDGGSSSSSGKSQMSAKLGAGNATKGQLVTLNKDAPRVDVDRISGNTFAPDRQGTLFEVPEAIVQQLGKLEVLQPQQGFSSFAQLATVVRGCSVELVDALLGEEVVKGGRRAIVDGPAGSGKSIVMMQAIAAALAQRWVVVSIPRAESLTDSSHAYGYDTKRKSWTQDTYASELCARTAEANRDILQAHDCSKAHKLDRHSVPQQSSLYKLLQVGAADAAVAHDVFDAFMSEMNAEHRPKLLLALDNLTIVSIPTQYRTPKFEQIHPLGLELVRQFYAYLSGERTLANGGAVVACTSSRPAVKARALDLALARKRPTPFESIDGRIGHALQGVPVVKVGAYTTEEAEAVIRHYADCGLMRDLNLRHGDPQSPPSNVALGMLASAGLTQSMIRQRALMGGNLAREVFRACTKQY